MSLRLNINHKSNLVFLLVSNLSLVGFYLCTSNINQSLEVVYGNSNWCCIPINTIEHGFGQHSPTHLVYDSTCHKQAMKKGKTTLETIKILVHELVLGFPS